jgi:hypothetical protein
MKKQKKLRRQNLLTNLQNLKTQAANTLLERKHLKSLHHLDNSFKLPQMTLKISNDNVNNDSRGF